MKNFLRGLVCGGMLVYVGMALNISAQQSVQQIQATAVRTPELSAFTAAQREQLRSIVNNVNAANASIVGQVNNTNSALQETINLIRGNK